MGENLIGMLALVMIACIILGMEVPTSAAYILVSFIAAPILIDAGVNLYAAHFFALYFAVFSVVTPPVAPAAAYGAALAKGSYFRTALESSKLCIAGFLVPYLVVFFPPLLMEFSGFTIPQMILGFLACLFVIFNLQIAFVGFYFTHCNVFYRCASLLSALLFLWYLSVHSIIFFVAGMITFSGLSFFQVKRYQRINLSDLSLTGGNLNE